MDRIAVLPDIRPTGYPAILKTGYRIFQTYGKSKENSMKILHHLIKTRVSKLIKSKQNINYFFIKFELSCRGAPLCVVLTIGIQSKIE